MTQVHGGFQSVAAVVARAAGNPEGAGVGCQGARQPCYAQPRALHQRVRRQPGRRGMFQAACGGGVVQRVALVGADAVHGDGRQGPLCGAVLHCASEALRAQSFQVDIRSFARDLIGQRACTATGQCPAAGTMAQVEP